MWPCQLKPQICKLYKRFVNLGNLKTFSILNVALPNCAKIFQTLSTALPSCTNLLGDAEDRPNLEYNKLCRIVQKLY